MKRIAHRPVGAAMFVAAVAFGIANLTPARAQSMTHDMSNMGHMAGAMPADAAMQAAGPNQVLINNFAFGPATLTVKAGTTVTWINKDGDAHTVTAAGAKPLFGSQPLDTGDTFSFTFEKPGTYAYFCKIHPTMKGSVIVR
ncbi:MAG TPA: cupredoxin family copper-binding protein [Stellaceae bacterium]|nr:cupredoxin family copper-binding protein [Stellaceae bacterium]